MTPKKLKTIDKWLILSCLMIMGYTVATLYISLKGMTVPDSITYGWYAFWGSEVIQLSIHYRKNKALKNVNLQTGDVETKGGD